MGFEICCNKRPVPNTANSLAPSNEREIPPQKYTSPNDAYFDEIETKYNVLTYIQLVDYINLLENYSIETATIPFSGKMKTEFSGKDAFLSQTMSVDEFQSFIENKLYVINEISGLAEKNELMMTTFKYVFREIYSSLELKLNQNFNNPSGEPIITKKMLVPLGIIFCSCNVLGKIKLIFDLFKNEQNKFIKSDELNTYLICSFLICSYCMVSARKKIYKTNPNIKALTKDDLIKCLKVSELKDSQNLVNVFNDSFFDKEEFTWDEFKQKFEDNEEGFQWLLSSKGIRKKLEENDV
jgi:hypothetical protein